MWEQTKSDWILGLSADSKGTGLFLIISPTLDDVWNVRKFAKKDIGYQQCVNLGFQIQALTIKWVPHTVKTYNELLKTKCDNENCKRSCVEPGCLCHPVLKKCVGEPVEEF
ncbi:MAG TPA: hypothetical protein VF721_07655 [Pyrinomonadaceae bacterium]|jgi:hypothetical protein